MNSRLMARVKQSFGGGRTKLRTQEKNKIVMTLAQRSQYAVLSGDCITPPSMVKCTSVGEIEEEDGTITVAHPSSIVMTTYFMGLGHYTIVMGKSLLGVWRSRCSARGEVIFFSSFVLDIRLTDRSRAR
ncbi:hypothetical protein DY000_02022711 [Brassica cretica]|uniref:Uncharacterized protein n=1 Tax=Brassica cretica TaxID=69181 RepID=A0ABQ7E895_BRACR|nr:hypothetical protein DY000_02022711 [Brassica cretica]